MQRVVKHDLTNNERVAYIDKYFDVVSTAEGDTEKAYVFAANTKVASLEIAPNDEGAPESRLIFHHADHLTGANVDTDTNGQVVQLLDYYPYGDSRIDDHAEDYHDDYQFTGKERDEETSLSYYEARYYDSATGRFISRDTWEGDLKDPQSLNKYSYVRNNPLKYVDPSGESFQTALQGLASPFVYAYQNPLQTAGMVAGTIAAAAFAPVAVAVAGAAFGGYAIGTAAYSAYTAPNADIRDYYIGQGLSAAGLTALGIKAAGSLSKSLTEFGKNATRGSVEETSVYSKAAEHAIEKKHYPGLSKPEIENIARQTHDNFDIKANIKDVKKYYFDSKNNNLFINNSKQPTIFKPDLGYLKRAITSDIIKGGKVK